MKRQGMLSMRNQDLSLGMMDVLRVDQVRVLVKVGNGSGDVVKSGDFVDVRVHVENRLGKCFVSI